MEVLVCDDHPIVASAIAMMLQHAFAATVHTVHDYRHAAAIASDHLDIGLCLLDIHIPGEDARTGIQVLQRALPDARFMLFSGSAAETDLMLALDLNMHGFLPKSSAPPVVKAAVQLVLAGGVYLPSGIADLAMRNAKSTPTGAGREAGDSPGPAAALDLPAPEAIYGNLTGRQLLVLDQVSAGRSNKEIARSLAISPATVKAHVAQIIAMLGVANRIEAAARARALGLIDPA